ncbi:MAG: hypothetical protein GHCLOJNM_01794 [bacterium]|nr:hypothetical protein [bacterium]
MTYRGHVENGVVVLDEGAELPEGAVVEVDVLKEDDPVKSLRELLLEFAGCMEGLPSDLSVNHDHYIHGTPKK